MTIFALVLCGCATGRGGAGPSPRISPPKADKGAAPHECPCKKQIEQAKAAKSAASAQSPTPDPHATAPVPVTGQDPSWGDVDAPVTIVMWSDFQCPFCARVATTLDQLKDVYGPKQIRLVWKHYPLPFHQQARPAAEAAAAVFMLGGADAFWKFHDLAFADQAHLSAASYRAWAVAAGIDPVRFDAEIKTPAPAAKVRSDLALGERLGVRGTPVFRINGIALQGALPLPVFRAVVDDQLAAAKALRDAGVTAHLIYPTLCGKNEPAANAGNAQAQTDRKAVEDDEDRVWNVPVDKDDPSLGPADALVTLVVWSDFQCPYCKRLAPTLAALAMRYGRDLRIVWKDFPMPFHDRALPAATLARLALEKKGLGGFWRAHDALFADQDHLDDASLDAIAGKLGLSPGELHRAAAKHRYQAVFDRNQQQGEAIDLRGTPISFVNGVRVIGAQPMESFVKVIDAQLAKARSLVAAGQPRRTLYQAIIDRGEGGGEGGPDSEDFERKEVAPPTADNPSKGPSDAPVTLQMFGDFQCPYCSQVNPILAQLEKAFPTQLRVVWRNYPLPFHEDAGLAAEAAQEVFAQKGAAAFWKYHDLLLAAQSGGGLERKNLERLAKGLGVELKPFRASLDQHRHRATVDRDLQIAQRSDIDGIPAFVINGYYLGGVQSLATFKRVVERALADADKDGSNNNIDGDRSVRGDKRVPK